MFESLVKLVMFHGAKIWGWKEQGKLESVHESSLKWIVGLDKPTLSYILMKIEKLSLETGRETLKF